MNNEEVKQFLIRANKNGYGNDQVKEVNEQDGSHTITYNESDWSFHDNFFGGEPFGGREVISFKNKPVWIMVYYGFVNDISVQKETYSLLKKALLNFPEDKPYRGPDELVDGDWHYQNKVTGEFTSFSGEETISYKGREVYRTKYQGGLVDK